MLVYKRAIGVLKKLILLIGATAFYSFLDAGEINFAGIFDSFGGNKITQQRELESRLESDINNFRSVLSSRVIIPVAEGSRVESVWGMNEARILSVEVILKLKKRRRLSKDEYKSIVNLVSTSLSNKNQIVQPMLRDEEGYEWNEESAESKDFFQAAALEHEIRDRLSSPWAKEIVWTQVHVSEKDNSCKISGNYLNTDAEPKMEIRRDVMNVLGTLCSSARLTVNPAGRYLKATSPWFLWFERAVYIFLGFSIWGLFFSAIKLWKGSGVQVMEKNNTDAEDAIILTQMVERSPDQAAKWMVRALLSESNAKDEEKKEPQIFDQSP